MTSPRQLSGKEVALAVGVGVAVAGLAGIAAGASLASLATLALTNSGKRPRKPLGQEKVSRDEEGRLLNWQGVLKSIKQGGISPELRAELWPALLGVYSPEATEDERHSSHAQLQRLYVKLMLVCLELENELEAAKGIKLSSSACSSAEVLRGSSGKAVAAAQHEQHQRQQAEDLPLPGNLTAFAEAHRIIVLDAVRTDFSRQPGARHGPAAAEANSRRSSQSDGINSGIFGSPTVTVLPVAVLDGIPEIVFVDHPPEPARTAPSESCAPGASEAAAPLGTGSSQLWTSQLAEEALSSATHVPHACRRQMLRLMNLLSAYAIHDPETGYCQGMSDLAAIFIQLFDDDALAFACFERLMRGARRNFKHDETGIKQQLRQVAKIVGHTDPSLYARLCALQAQDCMFAYRMVVVMLRRELSAEHAMTLWEIQWAHEAATALESPAAAAQLAPSASSGSLHRSGSAGGGVALSSSGKALSRSGSSTSALGSGTAAGADAGAAAQPARPGSAGASAAVVAATRAGSMPAEEDGNFQHWFVASAIRGQRWEVMHSCQDHDDVLRLFNGIKIDFWATLTHAEKCFKRYAQGRAVMQRL
ncbi:hypothetical protein N2152v2_010189 [Parachlorella kessleri]